MKILSFDASTTTIGISLLTKNDSTNKTTLDYISYFKPPKDGALFERFKITKDYILDIIDQLSPDEIVIEDFIPYMKGSNAATTILLATFNRMIGLAVFEKTGKLPKMINVVALRHTLKLTKDLPSKEEIPELVATHLEIKFPYVYISDGKKKGQVAEESFDIADAIALGLAYLMKPELAIKKSKTTSKKKKKKSIKVKKKTALAKAKKKKVIKKK